MSVSAVNRIKTTDHCLYTAYFSLHSLLSGSQQNSTNTYIMSPRFVFQEGASTSGVLHVDSASSEILESTVAS